jgi:hypothetical protein
MLSIGKTKGERDEQRPPLVWSQSATEKLESCLYAGDFVGLRSLGALDDIELYLIAFLERLIAIELNGGVMNEDIRAALATQKAKAFRVIEPLNFTFVLCHVRSLLICSFYDEK